jgi:putative spermidine/putrescine transport system ATP-binding protein
MSFLRLENIEAGYEKHKPILSGYNLEVEQGKLVSLLGPSGCGKTTTLRTIAGFISPTQGHVVIAQKDFTRRPPHKRNIGLVFQNYALFPHLSVYNNVAFGLKMRRRSRSEINERVRQALKSVGMMGFEDRLPAQLSGGQQQRVALARAIVIKPDLLLLDEPLSNLDAKLRIEMRAELRRLQQQLNITMLYVTHDQAEALSLSDRIVVMNRGLIEQKGSPEEIYHRPKTAFVARFMGFDNFFDAHLTQVDGMSAVVHAGDLTLRATLTEPGAARAGDTVTLFFRPGDANLRMEPGPNSIPGKLTFSIFQGETTQYSLQTDLGQISVFEEEAPRASQGTHYIAIPPEKLIITPPEVNQQVEDSHGR